MSVLNHLMQAAAVLLLLELLVVVLIFLGLAGGLAFGLRWVRGKTNFAFGKVQMGLQIGDKYINKGLDYAGKPFILASGFIETLKGTADALQHQVRSARFRPTSAGGGARPVTREEAVAIVATNTNPPPVLDGDTQVVSPPPAGLTDSQMASAGVPREG